MASSKLPDLINAGCCPESSSAASDEFVRFYTEKGLAYPSHPAVEPPEEYGGNTDFFFPAWEWILEQDMEYFEDACSRVPSG